MTSRHALDTVVGLTQASSVMPEVSWSEVEFGTLTRSLAPLNESAPPNLPAVVRVALTIVPALPAPDESMIAGPDVSSNEYAATSPPACWAGVTAVLVFERPPRLPAASTARTW